MGKTCSIEGRVVAVSHIFYLKPKLFFIAVRNGERTFNLCVRNPDQLDWQKDGKIKTGLSYRFSALKPVYLNKIKVFDTTATTVITPSEISNLENLSAPALHAPNTLASYENCRVLDASNYEDGFYQLDNGLSLCYMFMSTITNVPVLRENQLISILNAHRVNNAVYVCARSQVCLLNEQSNTKYPKWDDVYSQNCLREMTFDYNWGPKALLKAISLRNGLTSKFNFIPQECIASTKNKESVPLLKQLITYVRQQLSIDSITRSLSREFLQHDGCCKIGEEECWLKRFAVLDLDLGPFLTHADSYDEWTTLSQNTKVSTLAEGKISPWSCTVANSTCLHCPVRVLVGCLGFNHAGNWVLYNASQRIECIIEECKGFPSPVEVVGRIIYVSKFLVYRETFSSCETEAYREKLYVRLSNQDMRVFEHPLVPQKREVCVDCQDNHLRIPGMNSLAKTCYQTIYLISKTPFRYVKTRSGECLGFGLKVKLVSPAKEMNPSKTASASHLTSHVLDLGASLKVTTEVVLLVLHQTHAYTELQEGQYIRMYLPANTDPNFFQKDHSQFVKGYTGPKNVKMVILPAEAWFEVAEQRTRLSLVSEDFYHVDECMDIIHEHATIRGVIIDRFLVPGIVSSSDDSLARVSSSGAWFGMPHPNQTIVIKLLDLREKKNFLCVYFNGWTASYPLGLCCNSVVQVSDVRIMKAKSGNTYAETNFLSRVTILAGSWNIRSVEDALSSPKSLLLKFVKDYQQKNTLVVSPALICQVAKLVISNKCGGCGSERPLRRCNYAGCSWEGECRLDCKAWLRVEDGTGEALLFLTNENCKKALPFPDMWNVGEAIARDAGIFFHVPNGKCSNLSVLHQVMFRFLKSDCIQRRVEILCRKLLLENASGPASSLEAYCRLYGVDVREVDVSSAIQHFLKVGLDFLLDTVLVT